MGYEHHVAPFMKLVNKSQAHAAHEGFACGLLPFFLTNTFGQTLLHPPPLPTHKSTFWQTWLPQASLSTHQSILRETSTFSTNPPFNHWADVIISVIPSNTPIYPGGEFITYNKSMVCGIFFSLCTFSILSHLNKLLRNHCTKSFHSITPK